MERVFQLVCNRLNSLHVVRMQIGTHDHNDVIPGDVEHWERIGHGRGELSIPCFSIAALRDGLGRMCSNAQSALDGVGQLAQLFGDGFRCCHGGGLLRVDATLSDISDLSKKNGIFNE